MVRSSYLWGDFILKLVKGHGGDQCSNAGRERQDLDTNRTRPFGLRWQDICVDHSGGEKGRACGVGNRNADELKWGAAHCGELALRKGQRQRIWAKHRYTMYI